MAGDASRSTDLLVWVDCEMTGLDPTRDVLLEIAVLVTDADLTVLGTGVDLLVEAPADALAGMADVVRRMHEESGLLRALPTDAVPLAEAERQVVAYLLEHVPDGRRAPLAGSSVHMDRLFISRFMPTLDGLLHYRHVDVSTVKELVRRWYPRVYYAAPRKSGNHRAMGDIRDSIAELQYYRRTVLAAQPGPDSATAQAAAADIAATSTRSAPVH
jgi:oligoribonuclease